jgi:hypothetical protein
MRLELEKGVELFFSKKMNYHLSYSCIFCNAPLLLILKEHLKCSFTSNAQRTFVTLQFAHPMTEKCSMINTSLMIGGSTLHSFSSCYNASMQGISPCRTIDLKKDGGGFAESQVTTNNYIYIYNILSVYLSGHPRWG